MEGNIGCLVNGAGLAMATMDIIKYYGPSGVYIYLNILINFTICAQLLPTIYVIPTFMFYPSHCFCGTLGWISGFLGKLGYPLSGY